MKHFSHSLALSVTASSPAARGMERSCARKNIGEFTSMTFHSPLSHHTQVLGVRSATSQFILPLVDSERQSTALDRCEVACIVPL